MTNKASSVASMVNSFSFSPEEFCKDMCKEHRTLQQSFTRLCLEWIKTCSKEDYRYDGRNESSHLTCKQLIEAFEEKYPDNPQLYLPMI